jgi:hypothetical protein
MNWPVLLVIYQVKHLLCDYFLQGKFMLGKFKRYPDYIMPLFCHALVHFIGTFIIALFVDPDHATFYAMLDGTIHFIVDRIKASPELLGRFDALSKKEMKEIMYDQEHYIKKFPGTQVSLNMKELHDKLLKSNRLFWYSLGGDQMCHHLTHYLLIYLMLGHV